MLKMKTIQDLQQLGTHYAIVNCCHHIEQTETGEHYPIYIRIWIFWMVIAIRGRNIQRGREISILYGIL